MSFAFSHFHPNPGWGGSNASNATTKATALGASGTAGSSSRTPAIAITDTVGKHCILELYDCDCSKLDDEAFLRSALRNAALRAGATLLQMISHRFQPHGVTGLALLAESHISIHTWPESGYAAVDVFTCGDHTMPESACRVLVEEFAARRHQLRSFRRQTPDLIAHHQRQPLARHG
jgi:S-adenosylmethionine decarboxylase